MESKMDLEDGCGRRKTEHGIGRRKRGVKAELGKERKET
jgi:hypothetical protein